jgi:hypothetical protein
VTARARSQVWGATVATAVALAAAVIPATIELLGEESAAAPVPAPTTAAPAVVAPSTAAPTTTTVAAPQTPSGDGKGSGRRRGGG